jgi:hypothetical protein
VADKDKKTDCVEIPKVRSLRYFYKEPTEEKGIKGTEQQGVSKVAVVLEIELAVEEAKNKIGIGKESRGQAGNHSPLAYLFVVDRLGNHSPCQNMGKSVHRLYGNLSWSPVANDGRR